MSVEETADAPAEVEGGEGGAAAEEKELQKTEAAADKKAEKERKKAEAAAEKQRKKAEAAEEKERKKAKAAEEKEAKRLAAEEKKASKGTVKAEETAGVPAEVEGGEGGDAAEEKELQKTEASADKKAEKERKKAEAAAEKQRKKAEAAEEKERKKARAAEEKEAKRLAAEEKKASKGTVQGADKAAKVDDWVAQAADTDELVVSNMDTTADSTQTPDQDWGSLPQVAEPQSEERLHPEDPRIVLAPCLSRNACLSYGDVCARCKEYRREWTERQYHALGRVDIPFATSIETSASKWKEETAGDRVYYWHCETRETRLTPPPELQESTQNRAQESSLGVKPYAEQDQHASTNLLATGFAPHSRQDDERKPHPTIDTRPTIDMSLDTVTKPQPNPYPYPAPEPEPEPEPEPVLDPKPKFESKPESDSEARPQYVDDVGTLPPSKWRQRRRRREREAQLLQKDAVRPGLWWTPAGSMQALKIDAAIPAPGSGVAAARRRRRQTAGAPSASTSHAQMLGSQTSVDERDLFQLFRRCKPHQPGESSGLLPLLQLLTAVRTAARLGVSSSYMDVDYEKGKSAFALELIAVKQEISRLSNTANSDAAYISAVRKFARGSATELLAVRSRLSRSTFANADEDTGRVASHLCKELADGLVAPSMYQRLLELLTASTNLREDDVDLPNQGSQDAACSDLDNIWRQQAMQLAERVAQLEAEKAESSAQPPETSRGAESDSDSDSGSQSDLLSDSQSESESEVNTANDSLTLPQTLQGQVSAEPSSAGTMKRLEGQLHTAQQQLKQERDLRKAAEHALQEAIRARADARNAHRNMAAELQQVEAKQEELQRKLAADDRWLREKDARARAEEKVDELVFLLSRANLEADTAKHELTACKAQVQILEFNQTSSTSAKARVESSLDRCERDLAEAHEQQVEVQKRNEELHSALEKSRQENIALEGKLRVAVREVTDLDAELRAVKTDLHHVKSENAQERASFDQANRDAVLKHSQCEAEFARVVQQQQHYIENLEGLTAAEKLARTCQ